MLGDTSDPYALILHRLDEIDKRLDEVLQQAKLTNGRVTGLEKWRERIEGGRDALGTFRAIAVIVAAGCTVAMLGAIFRYLATH
jgi:hypothetical protein